MMNNIKLVIFDLDGTLVDAYGAIEKSFNYCMEKLGYPLMDHMTVRKAVGGGDEKLVGKFVKKKDVERAVSLYRSHHKTALLKYSSLMPNARRVLTHIKSKNRKLAVASNRPTIFSGILLRHLNISRYFSHTLCSDKIRFGKPHPSILINIMRKLRVEKDQTLYVGDMTIDAIAGKRAGIKTVILTTGSSAVSEIKKSRPHAILHDLSGLLEML